MHNTCKDARMLKHAQRKNNARTKKRRRPGVSVNNRFRIDVYLETREQVERVDKAAKLSQKSRSAFASAVVVAAANEVLLKEAK